MEQLVVHYSVQRTLLQWLKSFRLRRVFIPYLWTISQDVNNTGPEALPVSVF